MAKTRIVTQKYRGKKLPGRPAVGRNRSIRLPEEMWAEIDDWRREQSPIPNQSAALRELLTVALELVRTGKTKRK
jgi:Arc/MetJ-type ribon-helix-helix transcriptional regulator